MPAAGGRCAGEGSSEKNSLGDGRGAPVPGRDREEQRDDLAGEHAGPKPLADFVLADGLTVEVLLQEPVVALGNPLGEPLARGRDLVRHLRGDLPEGLLAARVVLEEPRLAEEQVHDAAQGAFGADRHLDRNRAHAEERLGIPQDLRETRALAVELRDHDHARQAVLVGGLPERLGLELDAGGGADDEERGVGDPAGRPAVAEKHGKPGGVEEIDLPLRRLDARETGVERELAGDLVRVEIQDAGALVDRTESARGAVGEEQRLGEGGLSRAAAAEHDDVPELIHLVTLHRDSFRPSTVIKKPHAKHDIRYV